MNFLNNFILGIPYLFLKKIPYAWMAAVFFWSWPPTLSVIFLGIVLLGLLMMFWQERAWRRKIRHEYQQDETEPYIDRPHLPRLIQLRNVVLLFAVCGLLSWLLNEKLGFSGWQWFAILTGTMLLYKDSRLLGMPTTYLITDQGIGIRLVSGVDYRLFFKYGEIAFAKKTEIPKKIPLTWEVLAPAKFAREGVLISPASQDGFSKQFRGDLLLTPADLDAFLEQLKKHIPVY
jgi:hypothetical protein